MNPYSKKANPNGSPLILKIIQIKLLLLQEIKSLYNDDDNSTISSITNPSSFNTPRLDFD